MYIIVDNKFVYDDENAIKLHTANMYTSKGLEVAFCYAKRIYGFISETDYYQRLEKNKIRFPLAKILKDIEKIVLVELWFRERLMEKNLKFFDNCRIFYTADNIKELDNIIERIVDRIFESA